MDQTSVLSLLAGQSGWLSGEEMSRALGVTRAAVWKQISQLRQAGWPIQSSTRLGYRLAGPPPCLSAGYLNALLPDGSLISADEADEDLANAIHQWRCWSYYKLQTKEIPN